LNWYIDLRCVKKKFGNEEFKSWVNNLPSRVFSELKIAFGITGYEYDINHTIDTLYRSMNLGNPYDLVMTGAAADMVRYIKKSEKKNDKIYEMLHRLHNKTWYNWCK
jgi:hypothetical protein